jgi:hypothetical protein
VRVNVAESVEDCDKRSDRLLENDEIDLVNEEENVLGNEGV